MTPGIHFSNGDRRKLEPVASAEYLATEKLEKVARDLNYKTLVLLLVCFSLLATATIV